MLEVGSLRPSHGPVEDSFRVPFGLAPSYFIVLCPYFSTFDVSLMSSLLLSCSNLSKTSFDHILKVLIH